MSLRGRMVYLILDGGFVRFDGVGGLDASALVGKIVEQRGFSSSLFADEENSSLGLDMVAFPDSLVEKSRDERNESQGEHINKHEPNKLIINTYAN